MDYSLAVLTHGRGSTLPEALRSFREHVEPAPASVLIYSDGGFRSFLTGIDSPRAVTSYRHAPRPGGFCRATAALWRWASEEAASHVFWLEHDFVVRQRVNLVQLAYLLDTRPELAQMQLMRNAVNEAELAAGGLFESRRHDFQPRTLSGLPWFEHRCYFTTNPSLMRRDFMAKCPWPSYPTECEGRFGLDLVAQDYSFGVWGDGTPWVEHVGIRSGFGY